LRKQLGRSLAVPAAFILALLGSQMLLPPSAHAAGFHRCGDMPALAAWNVKAKRVGCGRAKAVVRRYSQAVLEGPPWTRQIGRYRCKISSSYGDGVYMRCAAEGGYRDIRFARGG